MISYGCNPVLTPVATLGYLEIVLNIFNIFRPCFGHVLG